MAHDVALIDGVAGMFGVALPDAPGCTAMADNVDEAISNASEALREWMADRLAVGLETPAPIDDAARLRGLTRSAFLASAAREKIVAEG